MKKIILTLCLALAAVMGSYAQKGTATIGADFLYATDIDRAGLGLKMQYYVTDPLRLQADWDYYFKDSGVTYWTIDINANYLIPLGRQVSFYPLAGMAVSYAGWKHDNESKLGFNLGAGLQYDINSNWEINFEFKYQWIKHLDRAVLGIGFGYKF